MNANRILGSMSALFAAASICIGSSAYGQVVTVKGEHSETILQNSSATVTFPSGTSPLDVPTAFVCKSAKGCVVLMTLTFGITFSPNPTMCSTVDGVAGNPNCLSQQQPSGLREQATVAQGMHTVATTGTYVEAGAQVAGWETDYTIYEIK